MPSDPFAEYQQPASGDPFAAFQKPAEKPKEAPDFFDMAQRAGGRVAHNIGETVSGLASALTTNPATTFESMRQGTKGALDRMDKAQRLRKIAPALGAIPIIGPAAEQFAGDIQEQNYPEAFGDAASALTIAKAPKIIPKVAEGVGKVARIATKPAVLGPLGAGVGALAGHASEVPYGGYAGMGAGGYIGRELGKYLNKPKPALPIAEVPEGPAPLSPSSTTTGLRYPYNPLPKVSPGGQVNPPAAAPAPEPPALRSPSSTTAGFEYPYPPIPKVSPGQSVFPRAVAPTVTPSATPIGKSVPKAAPVDTTTGQVLKSAGNGEFRVPRTTTAKPPTPSPTSPVLKSAEVGAEVGAEAGTEPTPAPSAYLDKESTGLQGPYRANQQRIGVKIGKFLHENSGGMSPNDFETAVRLNPTEGELLWNRPEIEALSEQKHYVPSDATRNIAMTEWRRLHNASGVATKLKTEMEKGSLGGKAKGK